MITTAGKRGYKISRGDGRACDQHGRWNAAGKLKDQDHPGDDQPGSHRCQAFAHRTIITDRNHFAGAFFEGSDTMCGDICNFTKAMHRHG